MIALSGDSSEMQISSITGLAVSREVTFAGKSKDVPPGLARRDLDLPPGLAKRIDAGVSMPPGIGKRFPVAPAPTDAPIAPSTDLQPGSGTTAGLPLSVDVLI